MKTNLDTGAARFRGSRRWKILSDFKVFSKCAFFFFFCGAFVRKTLAVAMYNGGRDFVVVGSVRRRRERRLCCFLRHEEMAVRMALARASHQAVQRHQCSPTVSPPPAATYAATPAPSPVIEYVVPAHVVCHAAPAPVFEFVTPALVIEYIAPTPAVTYVVPSQQLLFVYTTTTVITDVNLDIIGLVYPQFSITAVEASAPQVVGSLPPF